MPAVPFHGTGCSHNDTAGAAWEKSSFRFRFGFVVAVFAKLLESADGTARDMLKEPFLPRVRGKDWNRLSNPPLGWLPVVSLQRRSLQLPSCEEVAANTALDFAVLCPRILDKVPVPTNAVIHIEHRAVIKPGRSPSTANSRRGPSWYSR